MGRRWYAHLASAVAVLLLALAVPAAAQLQTGDVYGSTVDEQGQRLPGVTVTLTGPAGAPQVQQSGSDGRFRFLKLYPGKYSLKADLQGFSPVEVQEVDVRVGANTEVQVTLSAAVKDVITVTGESPLLDERKTNLGANVGAADLARVPTARDPWSLLSQAPGVVVDRVNVGGNESGQQSNFLGVGSGTRDNTFAVDGVILTDMNAVGGSATYFDFGAFEEVQFTVSSADVTVQTSGVTVNQVTKRGTNEWRGSGRFLRSDGNYQAKPEDPTGNRIDKVDEYGADVGGPLWKDHLWIWGAYGRSNIGNLVPSADNQSQLDKTELKDTNVKMNFQAGSQDSGVLHYWTNDKLKFGRGAGPDHAPESTLDQTTPSDIYKVEDTFIVSPSLVFNGLWSRDDGKFTLTPKGGLNADIFVDDNGVLRGSNFDFKQDAIIDQYKADGSYFFNTGAASNELKFGGSFRQQENHSGTVWPHGKKVISGATFGAEEGIDQVIFYRNRTVKIRGDYEAGWVQDTLTLNRWTVNAGVRYDRQYLKNLPASDPGNPLVPGQDADSPGLLPPLTFNGNNAGGFTWKTFEPRVGLTYALGKDRNTLLRGTFSRYAEQLGQLPLSTRVNPIGYGYAYFYFADANHNHVLDPGEIGSLQFLYTYNIDPTNPSGAPPNVNARNLGPTLTDEVTFGVDQGFGPNFAVGVNFIYRHIHDVPEVRSLVLDEATGQIRVATRDDYVPNGTVTGTLPNGQDATVPVYKLRNGLDFTGGTLYLNGSRTQDYKGVTLSFNRRLVNRWSAQGHFNYNNWTWNVPDSYRRFQDPTDRVTDGLGFPDRNDVYFERSGGSGNKGDVLLGSRWSFGLYGLYQVAPDHPWGFNVAASVNGREGYISPPYLKKSGGTGSRQVQLTPDIEEFRNDNIYTLDARIEKSFHIGQTELLLGLDGFNLANKHYVLQRDRNVLDGDLANQVTERLSPRVLRFGATVRFR
ncbi:MAG TPA: carboxypeptidase regulatory-like domain-containing protein [Thermoanaerobaculia bacterium]|nr:carboxypeptidase regulatory-like domain-containing protein [Thermoanaerobaculia bacterium]